MLLFGCVTATVVVVVVVGVIGVVVDGVGGGSGVAIATFVVLRCPSCSAYRGSLVCPAHARCWVVVASCQSCPVLSG